MDTTQTIEFEREMAKNQMAFDLDNLPCEEDFEEESSVLPEDAFTASTLDWVKNEVLFVIVKQERGNRLNHHRTQICGRPMLDWLLISTGGFETKFVSEHENIIDILKQIQTDKPFMFVLYSDTPLMYKNLILKIMDYFSRNRLNALTLLRGYVFKTSFLKEVDNFISTCLEKFDENAFLQVKDGQSLIKVTNILQNKIFDYHEKNGVVIFDRNSTIIDADVEIDNDVVIMPNNTIKGSCVIGRGVTLQENNVVVNSILGEDCNLLACRIIDSNIAMKKTLKGLDIAGRKY